jgi:type VI secretion system protein ImpA
MRLTVWLAEAQAKTRGLRGLGDGYAVLAGLCEHYWAGLHPVADDGDYEQRIGNLCWLLARTPALVQEAFPASLEDAQYCLAMLGELERVVDLQLGCDGPGFSIARETLQSTIYELGPPGGEPVQAGEAVGGAGPNGAGFASAGPASIAGAIQNRAQALAQLRLVADFFRRTEPHSPVAYLADKAASWGDMPLHIWLRAVIKDPATIAGMEELLDSSAGKG